MKTRRRKKMVQCCNGECDCHHEFRARRAAGRGTFVKAGTPLSKNDAMLLEIFKDTFKIYPYGCTGKQIEANIFSRHPVPVRASGRFYNAHLVQAGMSILVGRGLMNARKMDKGNMLLYTLPESDKAA